MQHTSISLLITRHAADNSLSLNLACNTLSLLPFACNTHSPFIYFNSYNLESCDMGGPHAESICCHFIHDRMTSCQPSPAKLGSACKKACLITLLLQCVCNWIEAARILLPLDGQIGGCLDSRVPSYLFDYSCMHLLLRIDGPW